MKSGYYGFIPTYIRHHKDLKPSSKLLYSEIIACLEEDGVCIKRNIYFSNVLNISKDTASRCVAELRKNGYIHVIMEYEKGTNKFIKRYITPMQNSLGVRKRIDEPYMQNGLGVDESDRGVPSETPMQNTQTLLYNNDIDKIYTNGIKKDTPINTNINKSQAFALTGIVNMFLNKQQTRFPHLFKGKSKPDLVNKSINTLYDLIKKDGINYDVVKDVLEWALDDKFWHSQVTSLHTLRHKATNGNLRFHNILTSYNSKMR